MVYRHVFVSIVLLISVSFVQSQSLKNINIEISQSNINILESNPFSNNDVKGHFEVNGVRYDSIDLHYRGAYYLLQLMQSRDQRNWKVKFSKDKLFEGHREWNFNYENHVRQILAYHVFQKAGVPVVSPEKVLLSVNGGRQSLFLKYEDPDNKTWLKETFGDNDGDLYKAGLDMPYQRAYFADLSYLGDNDSDYYNHYRKQTNNSGDDASDYSSIREFISLINHTSDTDFERLILENFDVDEFIRCLVVSNFISNWDVYPYRPKNFFLYDNPDDGKWHFIPWDLDGTFQAGGTRNGISTSGSIFYYFDGVGNYSSTSGEPLDRPLLWRIMEVDKFRDKYCYEYKKAVDDFLNEDYLFGVIDNYSSDIVSSNASQYDSISCVRDVVKVKSFIETRLGYVIEELNQHVVESDPFVIAEDYSGLKPTELNYHPLDSIVLNDTISGKKFEFIEFRNVNSSYSIDLSGLHLGNAVDYQFPYGYILQPEEYFVVAKDSAMFGARYNIDASGFFTGSLSNGGEQIVVYNKYNKPIIDFAYDDDAPWPSKPDGDGFTLMSASNMPLGDPNESSYWMSSKTKHGSPLFVDINDNIQVKVYPNPTSGILNIVLDEGYTMTSKVELYDLRGKLILSNECLNCNTIYLNEYSLPYGMYVLKIINDGEVILEKVLYTL